jgi:putative FmdB family regulatory protein
MPVYEYECQSCNEEIEVWQNLSEDPLSTCPSCGGELKKIISMSSFQLKGGGWFADGYSSSPAISSDKTTPPTSCPKAKDKSCGSC